MGRPAAPCRPLAQLEDPGGGEEADQRGNDQDAALEPRALIGVKAVLEAAQRALDPAQAPVDFLELLADSLEAFVDLDESFVDSLKAFLDAKGES